MPLDGCNEKAALLSAVARWSPARGVHVPCAFTPIDSLKCS